MNKLCTKCNADIPEQAKFCPQCGTTVITNPKKIKARHKSQTAEQSPSYQLLYIVAILAVIVSAIYGYRFVSPNETAQQHNHAHEQMPAGAPTAPQMDQNIYNDLLAAVEKNPQGLAENTNLGNFLFDNQRFPEARNYYDVALKVDPNNTDVIVDAGVCYFNEKDFVKAKEFFTRALKVNEKHPNALYNLGVVAAQTGNMEEMMTVWTKLIEVAPESGPAETARQMIEKIKNQM